ncbi:hypothetical protein [Azospirillum sp. SYSU D00513]|uniref:hypothetical protein n=1 Tax=Azospirillum sp. SYSU D00513 TaxID=2812561 RepID=UPI001A96809C|nr:hypothetical protein [Azospirillum sp. SYSU D00513]
MSHTTSTLPPPDPKAPETRDRTRAAAKVTAAGTRGPEDLVRTLHPAGMPHPEVVKYSTPVRIVIWVGLMALSWGVVAGVGYGLYSLARSLLF